MKYTLLLLMMFVYPISDGKVIYKFSAQSNTKAWRIVNDGVMGGISSSALTLTPDGHGKFAGHVSLANYGGFASVQLNTRVELPSKKSVIVLRVKGDGKNYEFRLKGQLGQAESYVHAFGTSGAWEEIKLEIGDFYPQFRGRKLNSPNFNFSNMEQMSFLIANKREEDFELLIDWIRLE
ncbi:MAG: CIA30 family protein [Sphingobacteriaceae bacterium]|nr:CIA30 family protein [Sphingobacteriaceae bacterium]